MRKTEIYAKFNFYKENMHKHTYIMPFGMKLNQMKDQSSLEILNAG